MTNPSAPTPPPQLPRLQAHPKPKRSRAMLIVLVLAVPAVVGIGLAATYSAGNASRAVAQPAAEPLTAAEQTFLQAIRKRGVGTYDSDDYLLRVGHQVCGTVFGLDIRSGQTRARGELMSYEGMAPDSASIFVQTTIVSGLCAGR